MLKTSPYRLRASQITQPVCTIDNTPCGKRYRLVKCQKRSSESGWLVQQLYSAREAKIAGVDIDTVKKELWLPNSYFERQKALWVE